MAALRLFAGGQDEVVRFRDIKWSAGKVPPESEVSPARLRREVGQEVLEKGNLPGRPGVGLPFSGGFITRQKTWCGS